MNSIDKNLSTGLVVIIGDHSHPKREIAQEYMVNSKNASTHVYIVDPHENYSGFWKDVARVDERFVFDRWSDAIGESVFRLKQNNIRCILILNDYIDIDTETFGNLLASIKALDILCIITILDRQQIFPKHILDRADRVIYTKDNAM